MFADRLRAIRHKWDWIVCVTCMWEQVERNRGRDRGPRNRKTRDQATCVCVCRAPPFENQTERAQLVHTSNKRPKMPSITTARHRIIADRVLCGLADLMMAERSPAK